MQKGELFEGYGFIPSIIGDIRDNEDNYFKNLEIFLSEREDFLKSPFSRLIELINESYENTNDIKIFSESIKNGIITITKEQIKNISMCLKYIQTYYDFFMSKSNDTTLLPFEFHSLSSIFNYITNFEKSNISIQKSNTNINKSKSSNDIKSQKRNIDVVKKYSYYIIDIFVFDICKNYYTYPITTEANLKRISDIYNGLGIKRYESICSYLAKEKTEKKTEQNKSTQKSFSFKSLFKGISRTSRGGSQIQRQTCIHKYKKDKGIKTKRQCK